MALSFMTRDIFDLMIVVVIAVGLVAAAIRFRADMIRPLPHGEDDDPAWAKEDTDPHKPVQQ